MTWLSRPADQLSAGFSCLTPCCSFTDLLLWMNCLTQPIGLNIIFQFENLLKSNLYSWCGTVWNHTCFSSILELQVALLSQFKLLLWPISFVAKQDNPAISIPWLPVSARFILSLTKFHWLGSVVVWISPIQLIAKDLNFLLGFFIQYKIFVLSYQKADFS